MDNPIKTKPKLVRITTISMALEKLLTGQLRFMQENGFDVYMISSNTDKATQLSNREKSTFIPVNMTRVISPFSDLVSLYKLVRVFSKLKPDIVHSHTPKAGLLGMWAAKIAGVPVRLHTVAGLPLMETKGLKRKVLDIVERITLMGATKVFTVSFNLKTYILQHKYCKPEKLKVIGNGSTNGINSNNFLLTEELLEKASEIKKKYNILENQFVFIFIGRVVQDKGIVELIEAFSKLKNDYPFIRLMLVGPFEPETDPIPKETIIAIQNEPSIIHAGYQDDVRPFLAASQVLAFPSYREGLPNVPMQAGCLNIPSIVTNINGCNEIIENGINGLLIEPKNVNELYDAMKKMITDESLYNNCKKNARSIILNKYDQQHLWNLILDEYHQALQTKYIFNTTTRQTA